MQNTASNNLTIHDDSYFEKEFENPIYSDETIQAGHNSGSIANSQLQNTSHRYHEGMDCESTTVNDNSTSLSSSGGEFMKGATSPEGEYELPPHLDGPAGDLDENCYSVIDSTYSHKQAHLPQPDSGPTMQCPPSDDDYSHLQHK